MLMDKHFTNLNNFKFTCCTILLLITILKIENSSNSSMVNENLVSCDEFSKYSRFNPYSVTNETWMVFYYWGPPMKLTKFIFTVPNVNETMYLHYMLDEHVEKPINWRARRVLMRDGNNASVLLVEQGDRGQYFMYELYKGLGKKEILSPVDVRFRQTGDNKYIGLMICQKKLVYIMAKVNDIPSKNKIQDEVTKLGYRGRGGKSYLYQGHDWMPIPEGDERDFLPDNELPRSAYSRYNDL